MSKVEITFSSIYTHPEDLRTKKELYPENIQGYLEFVIDDKSYKSGPFLFSEMRGLSMRLSELDKVGSTRFPGEEANVRVDLNRDEEQLKATFVYNGLEENKTVSVVSYSEFREQAIKALKDFGEALKKHAPNQTHDVVAEYEQVLASIRI